MNDANNIALEGDGGARHFAGARATLRFSETPRFTGAASRRLRPTRAASHLRAERHPTRVGRPRRDGHRAPGRKARRRPGLLQGEAHRLPRRQARHRVPERERPVPAHRHRQRAAPAQRRHPPGRARQAGGVRPGAHEPRRGEDLGRERPRRGRLVQGRLRGDGRGAGGGDATEPRAERLRRDGGAPVARDGPRRQRPFPSRARL